MKSCTQCGRWKMDSEFYIYNRKSTGRPEKSPECRECKKHIENARHQAKRIAKVKLKWQKAREAIAA